MRTSTERLTWLMTVKCHELIVSLNGANACNYKNARQWIDQHPEDFTEDDPAEVERMKETNRIWCVQLYPTGSVSFYSAHASNMEAAVDAVMDAIESEYPNGIPYPSEPWHHP